MVRYATENWYHILLHLYNVSTAPCEMKEHGVNMVRWWVHHQSTRSLRSSSSHQLFIPWHNLSFGSRAFHFSAPRIWNKLPLHIRKTQSLPAFKRHLKTHFFQSAYPTPSDPPSNAPWFFNRLWRYISSVLTYLLTYLQCWLGIKPVKSWVWFVVGGDLTGGLHVL